MEGREGISKAGQETLEKERKKIIGNVGDELAVQKMRGFREASR